MAMVLLFVLSLVCAAPVAAEQNSVPRNTPRASYLILGVGKIPISMLLGKKPGLQRKLDDASGRGYQVVGGFESALILRKPPNDERYTYATAWTPAAPARAGDIASMEQQMNAAAARGFRLLPQAVLSYPLLAVMEKRVGASPLGAEYRVLSFMTDFVMEGDTALGATIGGRFDTDAIDERLAEMAVAGYRIVALVTRNIDEDTTNEPVAGGLLGKVLSKGWTVDRHRLRQELIMLFEKTTEAPTVETARAAARRYHILTALEDAELEEMLNRAAAAGYRLLMAVPYAVPEVIAVVEKQAPTTGRPTYGVLATRKSTLANELARADSAGWVPHSRGLFEGRGGQVLLVVERKEGAAAGNFLVLAAIRFSTLAKELNEAAAAGFEVLTAGAGWGEALLVMKR